MIKTLLATAALALLVTLPAAAQTRAPLLIEGKTTLYQKVLTRPEAKLVSAPGATDGKALPPMSVMFVYGRKDGFVEVGGGSDGKTQGFIAEAETIPWRHTLVMAFANPAGRDRVLFFKDRDGLMQVLNAEKPGQAAAPLRQAVADGKLPADSPVISIEPENAVDLQKQFYLLPILEAKSAMLPSGFRVRTVQIASVTREAAAPVVSQRVNPDQGLDKFRSGVVFVIDASSSMQPYIDRTREAVAEVLARIEKEKLNDRVRFGMIGYRDDPAKVKGIDYLAKTFADPNEVSTRDTFVKAVEGVKASEVSTRAFAEDAYAGLDHAIRTLDWDPFGGRFIVLITDASAREGSSPLSTTGLSTDQLRQLAQENRVALYVLHLQTPEGRGDHATAKAQYERLTTWPGVGALYFPVPGGDEAALKRSVGELASLLAEQVRKAGAPAAPAAQAPAADPKLAQATEAVGLAMRLAYLGQVQGTKAPSMFEAWAADRDFSKPDVAAFSVRVLLTKNQLSDLQATLKRIVEAGEKSQLQPGDFFNQLRSAAAAMGRDPARIGQGQARNLEQAGLLGEYLDGLPYQSKLMALDEDSWTRMGVGEQQAVIDEIKSKVALYQRFHDDVDRWVKLTPQAAAGDAVFPVPIDSLP